MKKFHWPICHQEVEPVTQDLDLDHLGTLGGIQDPDQDRILQKGLDQVEKDLTVDLLCQQEEDMSEAEKIPRKVHVLESLASVCIQLSEN